MFELKEKIKLDLDVPQLFVDDYVIDTMSGLKAVSHSPKKVEGVKIEAKKSNERNDTCIDMEHTDMATDEFDNLGVVIERILMGRYGSIYIALLQICDLNRGIIEYQWASSRDAEKWERNFRKPLFAFKEGKSYNSKQIIVNYAIFQKEILLFLYRTVKQSVSSECYFTLRRDGWVSLNAFDHSGTLVTKVFKCPCCAGKTVDVSLYVNARVGQGGFIRVSVLDQHGSSWSSPAVLSGDRCRSIRGDKIQHQVSWGERSDTKKMGISGQFIRLRFDMLLASIYSFGFYTE